MSLEDTPLNYMQTLPDCQIILSFISFLHQALSETSIKIFWKRLNIEK